LEFLDILPNEKMHNHPRKTRSAMHGCCGWRDLVKNLGDYEFGHRKPQGGPAHLHNRINYNIPYLPIPTKTQKSKNLAKKLKKISRDVPKNIVDHPKIQSTDCARQISLFMNKLFHIRYIYLNLET
jgi:hypothetical protein